MQKLKNREMSQLTTCRECGGVVSLEEGQHGVYLQCGQCGFLCDLVETSVSLIELHQSYLTDSVEENTALLTLRLYHALISLEGD